MGHRAGLSTVDERNALRVKAHRIDDLILRDLHSKWHVVEDTPARVPD
jgi:hypothetical protein